jgi:hypothetical protein
MAISRGKELVNQANPDVNEVKKSIAALEREASYIQKCINANLRNYDSGEAVKREIYDLIEQLKKKL